MKIQRSKCSVRLPLAALLCWGFVLPAPGQQPAAPAKNPAEGGPPGRTIAELEALLDAEGLKVLEQLKKVEESTKKAHSSINNSALPILREAAGSDSKAINLWVESAREVDFRDKDRKEAEFRDWKAGMDKRLGSPGAGGAIRLNLQFLILAIRASEAKTPGEQTSAREALASFMDGLPSAGKDVLKQPLLYSSALSTPIARRYKLSATVKTPKGWPQDPASVAAAYEEIILPPLRETKDLPKIQAAWQRWIRVEAGIASGKDSPPAVKDYQTERLPQLEWGMARDLFKAGHKQGANGLLQVIQKYPTYPSISNWLTEFKEMLAIQAEELREQSDAAKDPSTPASEAGGSTSGAPAPAGALSSLQTR